MFAKWALIIVSMPKRDATKLLEGVANNPGVSSSLRACLRWHSLSLPLSVALPSGGG